MFRGSAVCLALAACQPSAARPPEPIPVVPADLRPPSDGVAVDTPTLDDADRPPPAPVATVPLREGYSSKPPDKPVTPSRGYGACLRSPLCKLEGFCSPTPDKTGDELCIAADDDDCAASDACLGGRCTARDGECIAGSDEDCLESWACKGWGRCAHDGDARCIAVSAADCRASTRCQREGECTLAGEECVK